MLALLESNPSRFWFFVCSSCPLTPKGPASTEELVKAFPERSGRGFLSSLVRQDTPTLLKLPRSHAAERLRRRVPNEGALVAAVTMQRRSNAYVPLVV